MAEKRRFLDVWLVEPNTVYKEVPYAVVADWVQQGRLLEGDKVRPSGTAEWLPLGTNPEFRPYFPQADPLQADDQAEALEPVDIGFSYRRPPEDEETDVDMIPLIDVSLVLLIFFMLTASAVGPTAPIATPETETGLLASSPETVRIDIDRRDGSPRYALAAGDAPPKAGDANLETAAEALDRLKALLARTTGQSELVINLHKDLPAKLGRDLLLALREEPFRGRISGNFFGVSEREP